MGFLWTQPFSERGGAHTGGGRISWSQKGRPSCEGEVTWFLPGASTTILGNAAGGVQLKRRLRDIKELNIRGSETIHEGAIQRDRDRAFGLRRTKEERNFAPSLC